MQLIDLKSGMEFARKLPFFQSLIEQIIFVGLVLAFVISSVGLPFRYMTTNQNHKKPVKQHNN